ncbi:glycoside hydrolase family 15 [Allostreptomyces psammosilenae]|uniref:Glycoside hydrolase family 15 n=1 Tax=Allostreptomyces psammosilenae TaxID=1892865 RepID=A0A852ZZ05_9ACTN|nr:glycoside hydrolase family 15 [Allostreptomyces psammosilenae]NYI07057.1 hypothetical protein [Allostreptomyces psammosilenae]
MTVIPAASSGSPTPQRRRVRGERSGRRPPVWRRRWVAALALLTVLAIAVWQVVVHLVLPPAPPPLYNAGVTVTADGRPLMVPAGADAAFVPGTSLLADPAAAGLPDAAAPTPEAVAESRAWLAAGRIPGDDEQERETATRALLDLRVLTLDNGAFVASWNDRWRYVWPRDASFAVAAYAVTGHHAEARAILSHLAAIHPADGRWQARYLPDGTGGVPDDRRPQLDGSGWTPWAVWFWYTTEPDRELAARTLDELWPMVAASAEAAAASLDLRGLPPASSDYWEREEDEVTLGTVAPLLLGLRSAAALAADGGRAPEQAAAWGDAARRLDEATTATFGAAGYPRTVPDGGTDTAVTLLAPPFAPGSVAVAAAVADAERAQALSNGGMYPGEEWPLDNGMAWTPEVALFALNAAATGDDARADRHLRWLMEHRTALGSLPENVNPDGSPSSTSPLGWTAATVLLALTAQQQELPTPPLPPAG